MGDAGNAVNERDDFGKTQIELSCIHLGLRRIDLTLGCTDLSLRGEIGLNRVVEILLRNRLLFGERNIPIHVELGLDLIRLGLRELLLGIGELPFSLIQRRPKSSRIDLKH